VYSPSQYAVIGTMLNKGEIELYAPELGLFRNNPMIMLEGGTYQPGINRMIINSAFDRIEDAKTIVHEATHAIQDWLDVQSKNRFCEADAHIAGALAAIAMGWTKSNFPKGSIYAVAFEGRAKSRNKPKIEGAVAMVLGGKANDPNDPAWKASYELVSD